MWIILSIILVIILGYMLISSQEKDDFVEQRVSYRIGE